MFLYHVVKSRQSIYSSFVDKTTHSMPLPLPPRIGNQYPRSDDHDMTRITPLKRFTAYVLHWGNPFRIRFLRVWVRAACERMWIVFILLFVMRTENEGESVCQKFISIYRSTWINLLTVACEIEYSHFTHIYDEKINTLWVVSISRLATTTL